MKCVEFLKVMLCDVVFSKCIIVNLTGTPCRNGESERQPQDTVEGEEIQRLRMLNVFAPCTLQIGDKNLYTMGENDVVMMREDWRKLERQSLKLGGSKVKKDKAKLPESR